MALNKLEKEIIPYKSMPMAVEGIMELEKHHLINTVMITDLGKHHQWIIKLEGESLTSNRIYT